MNDEQLDINALTRHIKNMYFKLQLDNQDIMRMYTSVLKENDELKKQIQELQHFISVSRN